MNFSSPIVRVTLPGSEALVRLLMLRRRLDQAAGLDTAAMVSGYPGSPLGGFDLLLEAQGETLAEHRIVHRPGVNEDLAATIACGSQMGKVADYVGVDGVVGVWYGKTPGLDRAGDAMRHANALGSGPNGGFVVFCGDDPTAKSSTLAADSQHTFEDACIPVLFPGNQQELVDLGIHAFRISRFAGPVVGLKIVTTVADGVGSVDLDPGRHRDWVTPEVVLDGQTWRHEPLRDIGPHRVAGQELMVVHQRLAATKAYVHANQLDRVTGAVKGARLGLVCAGKTYYDLIQALGEFGIAPGDLPQFGIRVLKLALTYPLVEETVAEFAASVDLIAVIEEKRPFVEGQLRAILHEAGVATPVVGKRDAAAQPLVSQVGELSSADIAAVLQRVLPELAERRTVHLACASATVAIPARPPSFCSGCPHNRSTVVPAGALAGGGIGCHGIMYFEARQAGVNKLPPPPMGAEGAAWIGLAPFVAETHLVQNMGDGTFSHSGLLSIRASVAAGVNTTFKILYNGVVAMTGGQQVTGLLEVPALTRELEAEGVRRIVVCASDPRHYSPDARWAPGVQVRDRADLAEVQEELRHVPGVTAIIYDQRCATDARRLRKRGLLATPAARVVINPAVCENCGDCVVKSNCASVGSVETEFGPRKAIDNLTCNRDYTCLEGYCPSFVTLAPKAGGTAASADARKAAGPQLPAGELPTPAPLRIERVYSVYFTGVGGTGVVTANRLLAAAADAAGYVTSGMDQTGLAQKGGAVVSHLTIAADQDTLGAAMVGSEGASLYLSGDIFQAASPIHLDRIRPGHTVAVIESEYTPTAAMQQSGTAAPDSAALMQAIADRVGQGGISRFIDARRIAEECLAEPMLANIVMIGTAFQLGGLPFTLAEIETAMDRQGKAAASNRAAFAWGRWMAHDPKAVQAALSASSGEARPSPFEPSVRALAAAAGLVASHNLPGALAGLVERRTAQLIDYQNAALARRYLALVQRGVPLDSDTRDWRLSKALAEGAYKLLAYKDEYEVARLHAATDYTAIARELGIEGDFTLLYHLHPPALEALGVKHKLAMGWTAKALFAVLRRLRGLRGTPLDPFAMLADRRLERDVAREYEQAITQAVSSWPYEELVGLAASASLVRGYGHIKDRNVAAWRGEVARLRAEHVPAS